MYCSYCNTSSKLLFRSKDYNRRISGELFSHYRCPHCGLIFISPIPEDLGRYYPQDYHFVPDDVAFLDKNISHEQYKIEIIQRYKKLGRLLEIGPSLGGFAYLAKQCGFEVEAVEMDAECSRFLNDVVQIPTVNCNDTCEALNQLDPFDVVALWHVLEHLSTPWETLECIAGKINPGGILLLAAPNPDSFQFNVMGRYWPHLDAPRHLNLIPTTVLVENMERLGMQLEMMTTSDEGGLGWNVFGWEFFFINLGHLIKVPLRRLGRIFAMLLRPVESMEGKGCAYTIVFRKKD